MRKQAGFTLIEITIATALLASGILTATISYTAISKLQQKGTAVRAVQQSGRYILDQISRDVRNTSAITVSSPTDMILTSSVDSNSTVVEYKFLPVAGVNQLLRCVTQVGHPQACSNVSDQNLQVTAVKFDYHAAVGNQGWPFVKIDMTVKHPSSSPTDVYNYSYDLSTVVSPRDQ